MEISLLDGHNLTTTNKKHIAFLMEQGIFEGRANRIFYKIEKDMPQIGKTPFSFSKYTKDSVLKDDEYFLTIGKIEFSKMERRNVMVKSRNIIKIKA